MNSVVAKKFSVKPLVAAVAIAVSASAGNALAAPPAGAVPGAGIITAVNTGTTFTSPAALYTISAPGKGGLIYNGVSSFAWPFTAPAIQINNAAGNAYGVITWGSDATAKSKELNNAYGFNVGSSATLAFTSNVPANFNSAILNIDASGSPSFILGHLYAYPNGAGGAPQLFVANANGIVVGAGAEIVAPSGIGLLGADLTGGTSINDFIANNKDVRSYIDFTSGQASVEVDGSVTGNFSTQPQIPAAFALYAGGNIVHAGNTFANFIYIDAGMIRTASKATVNGASTTVNRLWDNDYYTANQNAGNPPTYGFLYLDPAIADSPFSVGTVGGVQIASASSAVNTGTLSVFANTFGWLATNTANGFRSGVLGSTDTTLGLFSDWGLFIENYTAGSKIELYNSVKGYKSKDYLPFLQVNSDGNTPIKGYAGDFVLNALTVGTLPSSITTGGNPIGFNFGANIYADNIEIDSTINHKLVSNPPFIDADLVIFGKKSVTINADIGATSSVYITASGALTVAGNVLSDTNQNGLSGIYIENDGTAGGTTTTISGNLTTSKVDPSNIEIVNNGISSSKVVISGKLTTHAGGDVLIWDNGSLDFSGVINSADDAAITVLGPNSVIKGPVTADLDSTGAPGAISYAAPFAQTLLYPTGTFTAPTLLLGFADTGTDGTTIKSGLGDWIGTNTMTGVNASGVTYKTSAEKPAAQWTTNNIVAMLFGSLRAPVSGVTANWLLNAVPIAAQDPTTPVAISLSAVGSGPQYINLGVAGDVLIDSGVTVTPFFNVGLTSGQAFPVGPLIGNGASSLIVNAGPSSGTGGALSVVSNSGAQFASWQGGPGFHTGGGGNALFEFPGGVALKSTGLLSTFVPMYNAWTTVALPYQGIWLESDTGIDALSYFAIDGNARVNFNSPPIGGVPNIYTIAQTGENTFGFKLVFDRAFLNTYSKAIVGTPINNCPIGFTC